MLNFMANQVGVKEGNAKNAGQVNKMGNAAAMIVRQKMVEKKLEANLAAVPNLGRGDLEK